MVKKRIFLKLSSMIGTATPVHLNGVLPQEKAAKEYFVAQEFAEVQRVGGHVLTGIESNPDDSEGRADVTAELNGVQVGIQLTELKIQHRPQSSDRARRIVDNLLELILAKVIPPYPVFVDIHSPLDYQNACIKLGGKRTAELATIIASAIANEQFSPSISEYFEEPHAGLRPNPLEIPSQLKPTIFQIEIFKIPKGHATLCPGRGNVHINFHFDAVVSSEVTYESLIRAVCQKKRKAKAPILLVWSCDQDFWGEEGRIARMFMEQSDNLPFDYIYLFFFIDEARIFKSSRKVIAVKERP